MQNPLMQSLQRLYADTGWPWHTCVHGIFLTTIDSWCGLPKTCAQSYWHLPNCKLLTYIFSALHALKTVLSAFYALQHRMQMLEQQRILPHILLPLHSLHSFLDSIQQLAPSTSLCLQYMPHIRYSHSTFPTLPLHDQVNTAPWPGVHIYLLA